MIYVKTYRRYKSQVLCKPRMYFVVGIEIEHFICESYNISTKMIFHDHESGNF